MPLAPAQSAEGAMIAALGAGLMPIDALPVALQPAAVVTVMLSATEPLVPAVKVIVRPLFAVMVPPVICQLYVAPVPASGTLALPVAPAQTSVGAVIVAEGFAFAVTTTASLGVLAQPRESVTTTWYEPLVVAVYAADVAPPMLVPPAYHWKE